jgi:hypothetical protein
MHVFGCNAHYSVHKSERENKLDAVAKVAIFVGYEDNNDTYYKLFNVDENKIVLSRDVKFFDESFKEMRKLKAEENTHNGVRVSEDDALPDILTEEMLKQLFSAVPSSNQANEGGSGSECMGDTQSVLPKPWSIGSDEGREVNTDDSIRAKSQKVSDREVTHTRIVPRPWSIGSDEGREAHTDDSTSAASRKVSDTEVTHTLPVNTHTHTSNESMKRMMSDDGGSVQNECMNESVPLRRSVRQRTARVITDFGSAAVNSNERGRVTERPRNTQGSSEWQ